MAATAPTKSSLRSKAKEKTQEKVLAAARSLFIERGYIQATTRDIAKAIGMSTGAISENFGGKQGLLVEVIKADFDLKRPELQVVGQDEGSSERAIFDLCVADLEHRAAQRKLCSSVMWSDEKQIRKHVMEIRIFFVGRFAEFLERGGHDKIELRAGMLWDFHMGALARIALGQDDVLIVFDELQSRIEDLLA